MDNEPTISDVLEAVNEFSGRVDGRFLQVDQQFADVRAELGGEIKGIRAELGAEIKNVRAELGGEIKGIRAELGAEIVDVRSDVKGVRQEMRQMKSDIITEIDHFVGLHKMTEVELVALRLRCDRIEAR